MRRWETWGKKKPLVTAGKSNVQCKLWNGISAWGSTGEMKRNRGGSVIVRKMNRRDPETGGEVGKHFAVVMPTQASCRFSVKIED